MDEAVIIKAMDALMKFKLGDHLRFKSPFAMPNRIDALKVLCRGVNQEDADNVVFTYTCRQMVLDPAWGTHHAALIDGMAFRVYPGDELVCVRESEVELIPDGSIP